jgi:hypothetical protein
MEAGRQGNDVPCGRERRPARERIKESSRSYRRRRSGWRPINQSIPSDAKIFSSSSPLLCFLWQLHAPCWCWARRPSIYLYYIIRHASDRSRAVPVRSQASQRWWRHLLRVADWPCVCVCVWCESWNPSVGLEYGVWTYILLLCLLARAHKLSLAPGRKRARRGPMLGLIAQHPDGKAPPSPSMVAGRAASSHFHMWTKRSFAQLPILRTYSYCFHSIQLLLGYSYSKSALFGRKKKKASVDPDLFILSSANFKTNLYTMC